MIFKRRPTESHGIYQHYLKFSSSTRANNSFIITITIKEVLEVKSTVNTCKKQSLMHTAVVYKAVLHAAKLQPKASQVKTRHHAHELTSPRMGSHLQSKLLHISLEGQWHTALLQSPALNFNIFQCSYSTGKRARQPFLYQNFE